MCLLFLFSHLGAFFNFLFNYAIVICPAFLCFCHSDEKKNKQKKLLWHLYLKRTRYFDDLQLNYVNHEIQKERNKDIKVRNRKLKWLKKTFPLSTSMSFCMCGCVSDILLTGLFVHVWVCLCVCVHVQQFSELPAWFSVSFIVLTPVSKERPAHSSSLPMFFNWSVCSGLLHALLQHAHTCKQGIHINSVDNHLN